MCVELVTRMLHDRVYIKTVELMTENDYEPRGCTALLDAVGGAIRHIGNVHKYARREDVPKKTIFVIITDGMENASHKYTYVRLQEMIKRQKEKYGWEFLFLGAKIDAPKEARRFGIDEKRAVTYKNDGVGVHKNYMEDFDTAVDKMREKISDDVKKRGEF